MIPGSPPLSVCDPGKHRFQEKNIQKLVMGNHGYLQTEITTNRGG